MLRARSEEGAPRFALDRVTRPELGPEDVLVQVRAAGLAPLLLRRVEYGLAGYDPMTLGHAAAGTVADIGSSVERAWLGTRVRVHPVLSCGHCVYCHTDREQLCPQGALLGVTPFGSGPFPLFDRYHDGTLAEYVRVPWWLLDELPPHVSYEVGAHVHDLATALRALQTAGVPIGGTLLVTAATGGMGSAVVRLARHVGIGRLVLVGRDVGRLAAVAGLAGDLTVETIAYRRDLNGPGDADEVARLVRDRVDGAVHAVLDFSPAGHSAGLLGLVAPGGTLVHLGGNRAQVTLQAAGLMRGCVRVVGSRGYTRADSHQVLDLLRHGALQADHLISHRYPLAEINRAADEMAERREAIWLVVVEP